LVKFSPKAFNYFSLNNKLSQAKKRLLPNQKTGLVRYPDEILTFRFKSRFKSWDDGYWDPEINSG
jgi:hypothetical protein